MTQKFEELTRVPSLEAGQTLLVAESGDLRHHDVDLRLLATRSDSSEGTAFLKTKSTSKELLEADKSLETEDSSDILGVVDAVSNDQNLPASFRETPVSYVAGPHELTRLSVALKNITDSSAREDRRQHLVVESLTPLLETSDPEVVRRFVGRTTQNSALVDGFSILTVDFTTHGERTVRMLRDLVDFVLWVEELSDGSLTFDIEQVDSSKAGREE